MSGTARAAGILLVDFSGNTGYVWSAAFNAGGTRIVSSGIEIKVWDATTAEEILKLRGHSGAVRSVSFSPDSKRIVSASLDRNEGETKIWEAASGQELLSLQHASFCAALSPNGTNVVTSGLDQIRTWDANTGKEVFSRHEKTDQIACVAFSRDGKLVAIGVRNLQRVQPGELKHIKILDATTGEQVFQFPGHRSAVQCIAFSPDGEHLASGSGRNVLLWNIKMFHAHTLRSQ